MGKTHIVEQGETLSRIAARFGFGDFHTILDHPGNAGLKARRTNPHVLFPGDEIFIPDREEGLQAGATGQRHIFETRFPRLLLRVRLRDLDNQPLKPENEIFLVTERFDQPSVFVPAGDAPFEEEIGRELERAEVRVPTKNLKHDLLIGHLDPIDTLSGQRARLNNLGYFAGFASDDRRQFTWAAEEFNKDKKVQPLGVKESDVDLEKGLDRAAFKAKLEKEHGS